MIKMIVAGLLATTSALSFAEQTTLACKGWVPYYRTFEQGAANPGADDGSLLISLNPAKKTASFLSQIGPLTAQIRSDDQYYMGEAKIDGQALGRDIKEARLLINRITGETSITYNFEGHATGYTLFLGNCKPGKALF